VDLLGSPTDFLAWAEHYVNQLGPLHPEPRDPDSQHARCFQYGADARRLQAELQRLSGHTWEHASKLVAEPITGTTDSEDDEDDEDDDEDEDEDDECWDGD